MNEFFEFAAVYIFPFIFSHLVMK